jgi:four helix bundle protein
MDEREFKLRTRQVGLRVVRLVESLPATKTSDVIGRQLLRSGTSIGANYRAACRGKSPKDVIAKLGIVEEEADESIYWIELLIEGGIVPGERLRELRTELNQIVAMTVASIKTLSSKDPKSRVPKPR